MHGSEGFVPYPGVEQHGVIGDRASAALVAADGTLDWLCLPRYDARPVFAALLDAERGGRWRLGPASRSLGRQWYEPDTPVLVTEWTTSEGRLELTDVFAGSAGDMAGRAIIRRLRCAGGHLRCALHLEPRDDFRSAARVDRDGEVDVGGLRLRFWSTAPCRRSGDALTSVFDLRAGEEVWAVLEITRPAVTGPGEARARLDAVRREWRAWARGLDYHGARDDGVRRSALTIHLLGFRDTGAVVAAATTSLPERIGGTWNADYRFAWVRDSALTFGTLAALGDTRSAQDYLDWLAGAPDAGDGAPLQVVYRVDGDTELRQVERDDVHGYRGSRPVRTGNHACRQRQLDCYGFVADCLASYLEHGGRWHPEYWEIARRCAEYICAVWDQAGNGIWELPRRRHFVSGRVMSWVALDRARAIGERIGAAVPSRWPAVSERLRAEILRSGFDEARGAFRQDYSATGLDASALLIPLYGFLPLSDVRVRETVRRIAEDLTVDDFVYRFEPLRTPGVGRLPLGEFEGAFLPCTFWLATVRAQMGDLRGTERILSAAERVAGRLALFAEGVDPRSRTFLGNTPLLFSHAEYVRAVLALEQPGRRRATARGSCSARSRSGSSTAPAWS